MPKQADVLSIDFAALRTLRLVCNLQSFSRAAEVLEINQSTVSYTIDRLRATFHDPLFVRQGGGIVPTQRCLEIVRKAGQILEEFEALVAPAEFEPSQAADSVTISCNYYERYIILPPFMSRLRALAPNVTVEIRTAAGQGPAFLQRGETDLLIGPAQGLQDNFYRRTLAEDYYVCVMDRAHPLAGAAALSLEDYLQASHAIVTYGGNWRSPYLMELERRSLALRRTLCVPSLSDLPNLLPGSNLISTIPSRFAAALGASIHVTGCPVPARFKLGLTWTHRTHHSAFHGWIRQLIAATCARLPPLPEPDLVH